MNINTFPPSVILIGGSGCGKHLFCHELQDKFKDIEFRYIDEKITHDLVEDCYTNPVPTVYIIDANRLSEREQNALLKLFEEPPNSARIIILAESQSKVLPTVLNRAVQWVFAPYSREILKTFLNGGNEDILSVATTPGQVKELTNGKFEEMTALSNLMIDKLCVAATPNALSITDKFSLKAGDNGYDLYVFLRLLKVVLLNRIENNSVKFSAGFSMYTKISTAMYNMLTFNVNKKQLLENLIMELKLIQW